MTNLKTARDLAEFAHRGQVDKSGTPYFAHVKAVAEGLRPHGVDLEMAGYLHDIIEDTEWTERGLYGYGIPSRVVRTVVAVTNQDGEDYFEKMKRITADRSATLVKISDNAHNSHPDRLACLDDKTWNRLTKKYSRARAELWPAIADPTEIRQIIEIVNPHLIPDLHRHVWNRWGR